MPGPSSHVPREGWLAATHLPMRPVLEMPKGSFQKIWEFHVILSRALEKLRLIKDEPQMQHP